MSGLPEVREMRPQEIEHDSVTLGETSSPGPVGEKHLRGSQRCAPRAEIIPVDVRATELGPGQEIGEPHGAEVTRYLMVVANGCRSRMSQYGLGRSATRSRRRALRGLHVRKSMVGGDDLARRTTRYVLRHNFDEAH
jgi:hypothetical protein